MGSMVFVHVLVSRIDSILESRPYDWIAWNCMAGLVIWHTDQALGKAHR
jgi:hypothetical protein